MKKFLLGIILLLSTTIVFAEETFKWYEFATDNGTSWNIATSPAPEKNKNGVVLFYIASAQVEGLAGIPRGRAIMNMVVVDCDKQIAKFVWFQYKANTTSEWADNPSLSGTTEDKAKAINSMPYEQIKAPTPLSMGADLACKFVNDKTTPTVKKKTVYY